MSPGGGAGTNQLKSAINRLKAQEHQKDAMNRYQQDLLKWSKNVDKRYAWVILAALWFMMAATLGPYRIYGLVFAKVTEDGVYTREEASWPVSTIFTAENIAGPFVSIIAYHISSRQSLLVGSILLCLGNGLTFLSSSLILDVLLLGVIQGIGWAFIFMPFMGIINDYFLKYRNLALGFALCGGTLSVFVWSPIFHLILGNYAWRTAYLGLGLVCCINLLMVPFLRQNQMPRMPDTPDALTQEIVREKVRQQVTNKLSRNSVRALSYQNSVRRQSTILIARRTDASKLQRQASIVSVNPFASSAGLERKVSRQLSLLESRRVADDPLSQANLSSTAGSRGAIVRKPQTSSNNVEQQQQWDSANEPYETLSLNELSSDSDFEMSVIWDVLKTPAFHLIWYNELLYFWVFSIYCLVMVDYGIDRGCSQEDAQYLLSFQSIGELIGRLGLTVLVDLRLTSNKNIVTLVLFLLAGLLVAVTNVSGFVWMATMTTMISAISALLYILLNGLLVDCLGEQQVTIGYGMASFIGGILMSFRPQAVGYFRDTLGSYDLLMICLAVSCAIGALLWIVEPLLTKFVIKSTATTAGSSNQQDDETRSWATISREASKI